VRRRREHADSAPPDPPRPSPPRPTPAPPNASTLSRRAGIVLGLGLVGVMAVNEVWFSSPPPYQWSRTAPAHADAVVVLSGDWGDRLAAALPLVEKGVAPNLVFAGNLDSPEAQDLCADPQRFEVVCFIPNPDGTLPEARATARLAEQRRWRHLIVVTSKYHAARAGMLFRRCFHGTVDVLGTTPPYSGSIARAQMWREWLGRLYYGVIARGC